MKRPFFKYAGSKWTLTPYYPSPRYDTIIEPFAGSACYASRHHERQVILIEKDPDIAALWDYLIHADPNEIAKLPTSELEPGFDIRRLPITRGAMLLIRQWQRVGMSNCWTVSVWNNKPGQWSSATRDNVAESVAKIRHWEIINTNALVNVGGVSCKWRFTESTWFIDPPYQGLPLYDSKSIDFERLNSWCKSRRGQVIVCEQSTATCSGLEAPGIVWKGFGRTMRRKWYA